ncbi:zinc-ribbon domain-containing protein [Advenella sp. RU8]|uniref:zinc-ribbon domain-containing protein n=1 Tax=Advenella sp. RU8 TaxID=3399575 RepID=UPI003AAE8689
MWKYCINCGQALNTGDRFCSQCGTAIPEAPANPAPMAQPKPVPPPQLKTEDQSQSSIFPVAASKKTNPKPAKRNGGRNTLCIVLSVLLVIQVAAVGLYGWPGFLVGGGIGNSHSFTLQAGQTSIETQSGVAVNFGAYNAMSGEKITVKELPADSNSIEGGTRRAYSITAGERNEFDGLITLTLPYKESETDPNNEEGSVLAEYYNPETDEWEPVNHIVNTKDNVVVITTDHLSDYGTVTLRNAGTPYAMLSKFSSKPLDNKTALAILREFEQSGKPGKVGDSLLKKFYLQLMQMDYDLSIEIGDSLLKQFYLQLMHMDYDLSIEEYLGVTRPTSNDLSEPGAELLHDVTGWLTDVSELAAQGSGYTQVANVLEKSGHMLLGLSALSLSDTMIEAYKGNESAETVAAEAYKLAYNVGTAVLDYKKITTGMVQLSMLGVIALDYSLNKFMIAADQTYKDALFKVVIAYNEEIHPWTDAEWYEKIIRLYKNRGDDPKKFNTALRAIMENFSARYFFDNPEEQHVATNQAGLHAYTTGLLPETDAAKLYAIEQYVARLGKQLQPVLADVVQRIHYDARKSLSNNAKALRDTLNAPLEFEIIEDIPNGGKSKYAGYTVTLSRPGESIKEGWTAVLDKQGRVSFNATILGYIQAGIPTQLRVWNKGDNNFKGTPVLTQEFKVTQKLTIIHLGNTKMNIKAKWFEGYWQQKPGYDQYIDVAIKIIDANTCGFYMGLGEKHTTLKASDYSISGCVFDPVERTLIIEKHKWFPNGIKLIARDKSEGKDGPKYGADYILLRRGEGYQYTATGNVFRMK